MRSVSGVAALPMSIWLQVMSYCAAVERGRLGEPGHRVLGRGIGDRARARRVRRDRAVVDDAAAARVLRLHDLDRFLRAQEHAGEVGIDDLLPGLVGQVLERHRRRADAGIVEQDVEAAEGLLGLGEQRLDRRGIADVGGDGEALGAGRLSLAHGLFQLVRAASGEDGGVALLHQRQCDSLADAGSGAGDESDFW